MLKKLLIAFLAGISFFSARGQLTTEADFKRTVYDRAYTIGISGHSRGYAISGRYLKYLDGFNMQGLEIDITKLRHPKEVVRNTDVLNNARGYVPGRINSFYALRAGYVYQHIMFDKTDKGSVAISWVGSGGLSLGLLKPIYVLKRGEDDRDGQIVTERYNGDEVVSSIYGEASYFKGIGETKLRPGIYVKGGFNFDYELLDEKVTSLEAGLIYDWYFTEVPIFYEEEEDINWSGFFQLYLTFNFGYKKAQ